jgi:hypothetical protein
MSLEFREANTEKRISHAVLKKGRTGGGRFFANPVADALFPA